MPTQPRTLKTSLHDTTIDVDGDRKMSQSVQVQMEVSPVDQLAVTLAMAELKARWGPDARPRFILLAKLVADIEEMCAKHEASLAAAAGPQ